LTLRGARGRAKETGADGLMPGKAIFGNPWLFTGYKPTLPEKSIKGE